MKEEEERGREGGREGEREGWRKKEWEREYNGMKEKENETKTVSVCFS